MATSVGVLAPRPLAVAAKMSRVAPGAAKRISLDAGVAVASRASSALILVGLTPYLIDRLGTAGYGVWVVILALTGMVGLIDVGLSPAVSRLVAHATAAGNHRSVAPAVSTAVAVTAAVALPIAALGWLLTPELVDWLSLPAALQSDSLTAIRIAFLVVVLANVSGAFEGVLIGLGRVRSVAVVRLLNTLMFGAGAFLALGTGGGLVDLSVALALAWVVTLVLWAVGARRAHGRRLHDPPTVATARELLRFGAPRQLSRICFVGALQYERLLVGGLVGATAAGEFGVASVLVVGLVGLISPALLPLIPALTSVGAVRDAAAVGVAYERALRWFALAATVAFGAVAATALPLVDAWVGASLTHTPQYVMVLSGGFLLWVLTNVGFTASQALGRPRIEAPAAVTAMCVYGAGAPLALTLFGAGAAGVATSTGLVASAVVFHTLLRRGQPSLDVDALRLLGTPLLAAVALALPIALLNGVVLDVAALSRPAAAGLAAAEALLFACLLTSLLAAAGYLPASDRERLLTLLRGRGRPVNAPGPS